jgi:UDP-N-acetylglucosamine pyrophosphorylase
MQVLGTEVKLQIPWIVMTSDATDLPTRTFFEEKHFFGLGKSQVCSPHAEGLLSARL